MTVKTLSNLYPIKRQVSTSLKIFDTTFSQNGRNTLKALRDMIEHFDDYATGKGKGPVKRETDLDPWRSIVSDRYERGQFSIDRQLSLQAANELRLKANEASDSFIRWHQVNKKRNVRYASNNGTVRLQVFAFDKIASAIRSAKI